MFALSIRIDQDELHLHGSACAAPLRGCKRLPGKRLDNDHYLEQLELILQGTSIQNQAFISRLQSFLERIRSGKAGVMKLQSESRVPPYESCLYHGGVSWIAGSVQLQGLGLRLQLERDDFWQGTLRSIPLSNRYGSRIYDGIRVDNHSDESGENEVRWQAADLEGELPAPAQLLLNLGQSSASPLENIYVGHLRGIQSNLTVLEAELADSDGTLNVVSDSSCNAAAYADVGWNGSVEKKILSWNLGDAFLDAQFTLNLRPMIRFANNYVFPCDIWMRWVLTQAGIIYQSETFCLESGRQLQALPIIHLPASNGRQPYTYQLSLMARCEGEGDHNLAVDAVFLLGLDGWRHFQPLSAAQFEAGFTLCDDSGRDQPVLIDNLTEKASSAYICSGQGIWIQPLEDQCLQIIADDGGIMPLSAQTKLEIRYRPRVRLLI